MHIPDHMNGHLMISYFHAISVVSTECFPIQKGILWLFLNDFLTEKCNADETI